MTTLIGTAGWSIPRAVSDSFPGTGAHLERYARILRCAEINSTFYRPPRSSTWTRWFEAAPEGFRFSVKAPKTITHGGLAPVPEELHEFVAAASALGAKLGPLLFQLPPKQVFDPAPAGKLLTQFRRSYSGPAALEPRHGSWFGEEATTLLKDLRVARVAADPPRVPEAAVPLSTPELTYFRLHGSPRTYYSAYTPEFLTALARQIAARESVETWVIFDNTASGAAAANALELASMLQ